MSRYIPYLVIINLGSPRPETNSITARGIALARGSEYAYRLWGNIINDVHARERGFNEDLSS